MTRLAEISGEFVFHRQGAAYLKERFVICGKLHMGVARIFFCGGGEHSTVASNGDDLFSHRLAH